MAVPFLMHAVPVIIIGPVPTCPSFVTSAPDAYSVGLAQLYHVVAMHELGLRFAELSNFLFTR